MNKETFFENITDKNCIDAVTRERKQQYVYETIKSVDKNVLITYYDNGYELHRLNNASARLKKKKKHSKYFEDRVWSVFRKMGYSNLNIDSNFKIHYSKNLDIPPRQIDVFCFDEDTAIVVECKSAKERSDKPLQTIINDFAHIKNGIIFSLNSLFETRKKVKFVLATNNIKISENDFKRLKENDIVLFTQDDISYYEQISNHLGEASKYQLFGRLYSGQSIPSLQNKVPAIKGKMGGHTYYSFSIQPANLLKLSYILHNNTTSEELAGSYQRMVSKKRINEIGEFLNADEGESGFFPNSIIINFDNNGKELNFDKASSNHDINGCSLGVLHLPNRFRSAFVIDGQHRLYGYSKSRWSTIHTVPVIAFVDLPVEKQVNMFVNINHKQKSVSQNLLTTIKAEINWNSSNYNNAIFAVKARTLIDLTKDNSSALYSRIKLGENKSSDSVNITLDYIISYGFKKTNFFARIQKNKLKSIGHLWDQDYEIMLKKCKLFFGLTFDFFENHSKHNWDLGSSEGGFISMNIGIASIIRFADSVLNEFKKFNSEKFQKLNVNQLFKICEPKFMLVTEYVNNLTQEEIKNFRAAGTGGQGRDNVFREFQNYVNQKDQSFNPDGLEKWREDNSGEFNESGEQLVKQLELKIASIVKNEIINNYGPAKWMTTDTVPKGILTKSYEMQVDKGDEPQENFLYLIDYKGIIEKSTNWKLFKPLFTDYRLTSSANKENSLKWMVELNDIRAKTAHPSRAPITKNEIQFLEELKEWLLG